MNKSNDKDRIEKVEELPKHLDYSTLPKEIEEAVKQKPYEKEKEAKLSWDGKQFLIRIPSDIADELGITKENKKDFKVRFKLTKYPPGSEEETQVTMELIK